MIKARAYLILFFVLISFLLIGAKLFRIQVLQHEEYLAIAQKQQNRTFPIVAERGVIKDRNGAVLSFSQSDVSYFVDTRMMNAARIDTIAGMFSKIFNKSKEHYINIIKEGKKNVLIEEKVPKEKTLLLTDFTISGLFKEEDHTRVYPYAGLASHVLGFVNNQNKGVSGIEKYYDEFLTGSDGLLVVERDVLGRAVSVDEDLTIPAINGNDLYLTINKTYQSILEQEIRKGLEDYKADSAVAMILDPNTGSILALVNMPNFDPNNYNLFSSTERRNRALTDTYEPGSTMKAVSFSILIDNGYFKEGELIDTENGIYNLKGVNIKDVHSFKRLTTREVLEQSSNIGMTKLIDKIDSRTFYKYLRDFGFTNKTSVDLPGETAGSVKKPDQFTGISKSFMSFGYELSVTPIQMAAAFCSLVNGGTLYQPRLVDKIVNDNGEPVKEFEPVKIRKVINPETSEKIKNLMVGVVEQGTGKEAKLENVLAGGKTGTSQQWINSKYSKKNYNSSFIGFFPAENPKVVLYILLDAPKVGRYGGKAAAPLFKQVAEKLIEADIDLIPDDERIKRTPGMKRTYISEVSSEDSNGKLFLNPSDDNKENSEANEEFKHVYKNRTTMPNLKNLSMRSAVRILSEMGLNYKIKGSGRVFEQSISAGEKFSRGDMCIITCSTGNSLKKLGLE